METGETGAMFMDRYNQKVSEIMSIDARQIPSNETIVTLLMNAIRRAFPPDGIFANGKTRNRSN